MRRKVFFSNGNVNESIYEEEKKLGCKTRISPAFYKDVCIIVLPFFLSYCGNLDY